MKRKQRACVIIAGVVLAVVLWGFFAVKQMFNYMSKMTDDALAKQINEKIDMSRVADGTYFGSSDGGMVKVEVEIMVKNHAIDSIKLLKHENGQGKQAETILDQMVRQNTDEVDAVSGATISSKTIRNAVNQALQQGMEQ